MGKILIIENNTSEAPSLASRLNRELKDPRPVDIFYPDFQKKDDLGFSAIAFDEYDVVLLDLELGSTAPKPPGDKFGRDVVLRYLRTHARWIPVILLSAYLGSDDNVAECSTYGFDGLLSKEFFGSNNFYAAWPKIDRQANLCRVASLTGRDVFQLRDELEGQSPPPWGETLKQQIKSIGEDTLLELLRLAGLAAREVPPLEHIEQGYSGSLVFRARCERGGRVANWLVKVSQEPAKLDREISRHRIVFLDGVTRRVTVPPLWWAPIVAGSTGLIAYEFERDSKSLLEFIQDNSLKEGLEVVQPALAELYGEIRTTPITPLVELTQHFGKLDVIKGIPQESVVFAFANHLPNDDLDQPLTLRYGRHHGDLHARNVLISDLGPAIIDFAHYVSYDGKEPGHGIPLLDLAKLSVDLWVNECFSDTEELLSGKALESRDLHPIIDLFIRDKSDGPNPEEVKFFGMAVQCHFAKYLSYPELPDDVRVRIREGFESYSS